jgi:transforming growth factor-beta-induced protein
MSPTRAPRIVTLLVAFVLLAAASCGDDETQAVISTGNNPVTAPRDIVDTALDAELSTLVAALTATGLDEDLREEGPFTVFAPSEAAFEALPEGLIPLLLEEEDLLRDILVHHVVDGLVLSPELIDTGRVTSLEGSTITVEVIEEPAETEDAQPVTYIEVGGAATLETPDQLATNGVVHVIDAVLIPSDRADDFDELVDSIPEVTDILSTAEEAGNFEMLLALIDQAGLTSTLRGDGPFTVFAPTDTAFNRLTPAQRAALDEDRDLLESVLSFHIVGRQVNTFDTSTQQFFPTLEGQGARLVNEGDGNYSFAGVSLRTIDIQATNGVIHVVDTVLVPDSARGPGGL